LRFHYVQGQVNPTDILSKHWDYSLVWPMLKPLMFWQGDTKDLALPLQEDEDVKPVQGTLVDQAPPSTMPHQGE
jgi:hypothetical protein